MTPACVVCGAGNTRYREREWFCPTHLSRSAYRAPCSTCGAVPTRRFMNARLCSEHAPAQPVPDPNATAPALRARYERLVLNPRKAAI